MKKIFLILSLLLAYIAGFSQLDSSSNIFNDLRGNIWYKASNIPAWQIDGYRAIIFNGDTLVRGNSGVFRAEEVEVYSNGSDMSSPLQDAFDYSGIKWISFGSDSARTYVFNSSVNAHSKTLKFENGNKLDGNGTIDSLVVDASDEDQIFGSSITITHVKGVRGYISPKWWGAKGDNINNDTQPVQKAVSIPNVEIRFPNGSYKTTDSITVDYRSVPVMKSGSEIVSYTTDRAGMILGSYNPSNLLAMRGVEAEIRIRRATQSDWSDTSSIGVKIINANYTKIKIMQANNFTVGMKTIGYNAGTAYVDYELGVFQNNKYGVYITNYDVSSLAWNNQVNFYSGWFRVNTSVNVGQQCFGIYADGAGGQTFSGLSFEFDRSNAIPVYFKRAQQCQVLNFRSENGGDTVVYIAPYASNLNNKFTPSYNEDGNIGKMFDYSGNATNIFNPLEDQSRERSNYTVIAEVNNIVDYCSYLSDSSVNIAYPGLFMQRSGGGLYPVNTLSGVKIVGDYLDIKNNATFGVSTDYIDVSILKRFVIKQDVEEGSSGAGIYINIYDKNKQLLPEGVGSVWSSIPFNYVSTYGLSYSNVYSLPTDLTVGFPDTVKYVRVNFGRGTDDCKFKGYKIVSYEPRAATVYATVNNRQPFNVAPAKPSLGSYMKGRIIFNSSPSDSVATGWICAASGTFGTLAGVTGTISNGTTMIVLNSGSGALVQKRQWLSLNSIPSQIIGISGDTIWINRALTGGTITGGAINYATPQFVDLSISSSAIELINQRLDSLEINDSIYANQYRVGDSIYLQIQDSVFKVFSPLSYDSVYTPSYVSDVNVASYTLSDLRYMVVDSSVHVWGRVVLTPSTAALTSITLSPPIATTLGSVSELSGSGGGIGATSIIAAVINTSTTSGNITISLLPTGTEELTISFSADYIIR